MMPMMPAILRNEGPMTPMMTATSWARGRAVQKQKAHDAHDAGHPQKSTPHDAHDAGHPQK